MISLADWLLERFAEDEAGPRNWLEARRIPMEDRVAGRVGIPLQYGTGGVDTEWVVDPARVLAECAAKRRIVKDWQTWNHAALTTDYHANPNPSAYAHALHRVLQNLALPYADHPDYREEWRP
jgi:hypothetical protein